MSTVKLYLSLLALMVMAGCTSNPPPPVDPDPANTYTPIGSAVDGLHFQDQVSAQPGCRGMDSGPAWMRPCGAESPLLGKTVVGQPSLDAQAQPTPSLHNPIYVTATFVPISPIADPDYNHEFTVVGTADYLAGGVARSAGSPDVALKVSTGWNGKYRVLYYTLETDANGAAPHELADVSGSQVLPAPDAAVGTSVTVANGAVPLDGQNYDVQIKALVPPQVLINLNKAPDATQLREFPAEMPDTSAPPPAF
jgi:hypothetical protein